MVHRGETQLVAPIFFAYSGWIVDTPGTAKVTLTYIHALLSRPPPSSRYSKTKTQSTTRIEPG